MYSLGLDAVEPTYWLRIVEMLHTVIYLPMFPVFFRHLDVQLYVLSHNSVHVVLLRYSHDFLLFLFEPDYRDLFNDFISHFQLNEIDTISLTVFIAKI